MSSPLSRGGRYLAALISTSLDRVASPRIQLQQALDEARRRHQALTEQAAAVLGNERELEARVGRSMATVERLRSATAQALLLSDRALKAGDRVAAHAHEETATLFAVQLAAAESMAGDLSDAKEDAAVAAAAARRAVDQSAFMLHARIAEGTHLSTRIETAHMQERIADTLNSLDELVPSGSVPTLEEIRERVDRRLSLASARSELAQRGAGARLVEIERALLEESGRLKLAEVRGALGLPAPISADDGEGTAGGAIDGAQ